MRLKYIGNITKSFVELDHRDRERVALVGDCVVTVLCDPALGQAVGGAGVHQTVVEAHADDGSAVSF